MTRKEFEAMLDKMDAAMHPEPSAEERAHRLSCPDFAESFKNPECPQCQQLTGLQRHLPTRADHKEYVNSERFKALCAAVEATRPLMQKLHTAIMENVFGEEGEGDE